MAERSEPAFARAAQWMRTPAVVYLLLALTMLIWAANFVLVRAVHADIPPIALSFWRWFGSALVLAPFALPGLRRAWPAIRAHWKLVLFLAFMIVVAGNTVLYIALQFTSAINAALINAAQPGLTYMLAFLLIAERARVVQTYGMIIALSGVVLVIVRGDIAVLLGLGFNIGDLLVVLAIVGWSLYAVYVRRAVPHFTRVTLAFLVMFMGSMCTLPLVLWEMFYQGRFFAFTPINGLIVLYMAGFAGVLGLTFWNHGLAVAGPHRATIFTNLLPIFTALISIPVLGESLHLYHLIGMGLVFVGIWLVTRPPRTGTP